MLPSPTTAINGPESQHKRLTDLITALKYQESLERIPVSKASEKLIGFCRNTPDPLIRAADGDSSDGRGSSATSAATNPFIKKSKNRRKYFCF